MDPVEQQIYSTPHPRRGGLQETPIHTMVANTAFLVKYTAGSKVQAKDVSISFIAVRGPKNIGVGHKATVCIHCDKPGDFTVVVSNQVNWDSNVISGLTKKVDEIVNDILAREGNKGYGDFKI